MSDQLMFIADIHGNIDALEAVLNHARDKGYLPSADVYSLGDIVGYGPDPGECVDCVRSIVSRGVVGNHDAAAVGRVSTEWFNRPARRAAHWTAEQLSSDQRKHLESLPEHFSELIFHAVHGSPGKPLMEYITDPFTASEALDEVNQNTLVVGHTHKPAFFRCDKAPADERIEAGKWYTYDPGSDRAVLNPGSVGQPRDGDPRAAYMIVDCPNKSVRWERVEYPVERTQEKIYEADLPRLLGDRLTTGN